MAQVKRCDGCSRSRGCKDVYRQVGCADGPSVTANVLLAFLLPILLFAVGLGAFGQLLSRVVAAPYRTPLALVMALTTTAALMGIVQVALRHHRNRQNPEYRI